MAEEKENTELAIISTQENQLVKFDQFESTNEMLKFAEVLIQSKLIPTALKTPEAVVSIILTGKELGLSAMTSLSNISVIQGRATLGIHAIMALVKKANIRYTITKDYEAVFNEEGKKIDLVTEVKFFEMWEGKIIENTVPFYWSDAVKAGYTDKDNWKKHPRIMLRTRALAVGARIAAPDSLMGIFETSEHADFTNTTYTIDEDGKVTL